MKVLIADDDPTLRRMLRHLVAKWGYEPIEAADGYGAWASLQAPQPPRILILDWHMPRLDGLHLCREVRLRHTSNLPYLYIIFLTARQDKEDLLTALEAGADDYLVKPFDTRELEGRLRAGRRIIELQDDLLKAKEEIAKLSVTDPLTGILNRRGIMDGLGREIADAMVDATPLSVLIADLDAFKRINDRFGHAAGDAALRAAGQGLDATVKPPALLGRFGGDEFLVVIPRIAPARAIRLGERILTAVARIELPWSGARVALSACGGLAIWDRQETTDSLLARADAALYQAKAADRPGLVVAHPAHSELTVPEGTSR